jgi:hypothetical protein
MCGVCGHRMTVRYHDRRGQLYPDYNCGRSTIDLDGPRCQSIPGHPIDQAIAHLVLDTMNPVSAELALAVQYEISARHQETLQLRNKQVERAQYEAELARHRYMRCDPDNRLVASNLEADWNQALRNLDLAQIELEQHRQNDRLQVTQEIRTRVTALTTDFPALWHDPKTTDRDRKRLVRLLIEDITLIKSAHGISVQVRFRGGATKSLTLSAPKTSWQTWMTRPEIITQIDTLLNDYTDQQVADNLNRQGLRSGKGVLFSAPIIARLRREYDLRDRYSRLRDRGFLTVAEIAKRLSISTTTVKIWRRCGLLRSHAYTNKPECLYELPTDHPLPSKRQGCKLNRRQPVTDIIPIRSKEVHLDA